MSSSQCVRRWGGPYAQIALDVVRDFFRRRAWGSLALVLLALLALALGVFSHATVPFLVYGGL